MRHSTITLTIDTYGHLMPGAEAEAISGLGSFFEQADSEPVEALRTCTYDTLVDAERSARRKKAQILRERRANAARAHRATEVFTAL